jgi:hypothetical protein
LGIGDKMSLKPEDRKFAVIENNKVINIVVGVDDEVIAADPERYLEYTNGWNYDSEIDGGVFFPTPSPYAEESIE